MKSENLWKPIDTAPEDTIILLAGGNYPDSDFMDFGYRKRGESFIINNGDYLDGGYGQDYICGKGDYPQATHWMPLPKPPNKE